MPSSLSDPRPPQVSGFCTNPGEDGMEDGWRTDHGMEEEEEEEERSLINRSYGLPGITRKRVDFPLRILD